VDRIRASLRTGRRLIEPFAGSGAVFLNTAYDRYLLADSNPDLIDLYKLLTGEGEAFIKACRRLFRAANNNADCYYGLREKFNRSQPGPRRSALFLYLNRHCYNGLCRYNSSGEFNTPFGRYMRLASHGDVVYCDPPYAPLSRTAYFTDYHIGGFKWDDQVRLAETAAALASRGVQVVISNHDTRAIRALYRGSGATVHGFRVPRTISCNPSTRRPVGELLAVFG
jgi:DNA adenine methylase